MPVPVAELLDPPGADEIPALPEFCGTELGALMPPGEAAPPAVPPAPLPPPVPPVWADAPDAASSTAAMITPLLVKPFLDRMTFSLCCEGRTEAGAMSFRAITHELGQRRRNKRRRLRDLRDEALHFAPQPIDLAGDLAGDAVDPYRDLAGIVGGMADTNDVR